GDAQVGDGTRLGRASETSSAGPGGPVSGCRSAALPLELVPEALLQLVALLAEPLELPFHLEQALVHVEETPAIADAFALILRSLVAHDFLPCPPESHH